MANKKGIILMNLGSPDSTKVKDVRRYLNEFLMDERVIDISYLGRLLLVKGIIVPFRAPKSAHAYSTIWWKEGSPLIELTKQTAVEYMKEIHAKEKYNFKLTTIKPYYNNPDYINAMAENMKPFLEKEYDHILFSYHGVPGRHIKKSDITGCHCLQKENCCDVASPAHDFCYRHQCFTTTKLVTEKLNIPANKFSISFQSRLGKGWLEPFTDIRLEQMPKEGIKKLLIICPAFVSDCLETLEEIAERGKETFIEAGGEEYTMIPCLNVHPLWVSAISKWLKEYADGNKEMILA
ncbi:MAG: ferrochelatase [Sphingobacteriales bacterium]|nr:ferrochelatase [Sphingobacteriales bacterium]